MIEEGIGLGDRFRLAVGTGVESEIGSDGDDDYENVQSVEDYFICVGLFAQSICDVATAHPKRYTKQKQTVDSSAGSDAFTFGRWHFVG